jgi:two-component system nitrate/nitrite response regulator NarL
MPNITVLSADECIHQELCTALGEGDEISLLNVNRSSETLILNVANENKPDIFLMKGPLTAAEPLSLLTRMQAVSPNTRTIVFYDFCSHRDVIDAMANGVQGCIEKSASPKEWPKAIRIVHDGNFWIHRQLLVESLGWLLENSRSDFQLPDSKPKVLTAREWEVVHWVRKGMTNKEIARQLAISDTTVKTHLQHIYGKLEIRRRLRLPAA